MTVRVLVTRAEPGAGETAERLKQLGYEPIVEPLLAVTPIPGVLPTFDALAFTSANGVRVFSAMSQRRDVPVYCVGARTTEEARHAGFRQVESAGGDVEALAQLIAARLPPRAVLLHAGNEESRGDLAGALLALGISAVFQAIYRAVPVSAPGPSLAAHLRGIPAFDAVLIHSPRSARILAGFLTARQPPPFDAAAISPAAAGPLGTLPRRIEVAAAPNEQALLEALKRLTYLG